MPLQTDEHAWPNLTSGSTCATSPIASSSLCLRRTGSVRRGLASDDDDAEEEEEEDEAEADADTDAGWEPPCACPYRALSRYWRYSASRDAR